VMMFQDTEYLCDWLFNLWVLVNLDVHVNNFLFLNLKNTKLIVNF
jgi:hypothetical protein